MLRIVCEYTKRSLKANNFNDLCKGSRNKIASLNCFVWCGCSQKRKFYFQRCGDASFYSYASNSFELYGWINDIKVVNCFSRLNIKPYSTSRNRCWKCNAIVTERDLVCLSCGSVQEPNKILNHFEVFKETPHFDIDSRNLTVKFRRLQNLLHPDKFATRSKREQQYSQEQSSRVNKAYQTLFRPIERGLYLLELYGKPLLEGEIEMPSDFLMDVMEINEELVETTSPETVKAIRNKNDIKLKKLFAELSFAFKEKDIEVARNILAKLQYFQNIDGKIKDIEEKLGIVREDC